MEQDYDKKFEEMKKYIPFLERMIKRLETNRTSGNPRQAQLAKIRSLRDLLLDKKKRMKMENLLKCEQVLINLYAKVEQRDCFPELKNDIDTSLGTQNEELNLVRNKLKNVVSHLKDQETLPEIARASTTEEACTVGSKEPALFQRRPNKTSLSPPRASLNNSTSPSPSNNRTYSRVLISPEHDTKDCWPHEKSSDKPLYSRRSPRRTPKNSPRRRLSPHNKKDRKKSVNQSQVDQADLDEPKDFNITLKVPEASLNSLNTKDIVSRIINCNDNDVDIDTLRGLRTQILSELKQTGAKDDISDLILQSYKNKKEVQKKEEIEEGELSDSESEIIESVYGNLVIVDKDQKNSSATRKSDNKDEESRKIQICLVINSEKEKENEADKCNDNKIPIIDQSDFESFKDSKKDSQNVDIQNDCSSNNDVKVGVLSGVDVVKNKETLPSKTPSKLSVSESSKMGDESKSTTIAKLDYLAPKTPVVAEQSKEILTSDNSQLKIAENKISGNEGSKKQDQVEIPLLDIEANTKQVVYEIDILQALKKEILSEKMLLDDSGTVTPPLHQPKVTKVANMHGMITKKRISIEKYKEKSTVTATSKPCLYPNQNKSISLSDELLKKQSLKLTEKEYERFNLSNRLAFQESSEDEDIVKRSPTIEDVYGDLVPKSPDHEDFADTGIRPPVIIPADPIKATVVASKADVDMRLPRSFSPSVSASKLDNKKDATNASSEKKYDVSNSCEAEINSNEKRVTLGDPRVRREFNYPIVDTSILGPVDRNPRPPLLNFPPNVTPNMKPNVISKLNPNMSGITQNSNVIANPPANAGVYEMAPSRQNFENDEYLQNSHGYTSPFLATNIYDNKDMVNNDGHNRDTFARSLSNFVNVRNDLPTMNNDFHNTLFAENPASLFNRLECPPTPIHPFGMSDCPPTTTHGRALLETPMTPIVTFGRCDAPMTPVHPFGLDCPPTPNHPFGGRTETIVTTNHQFVMADFAQNQVSSQIPSRYTSFQDSRGNRNSDYNNFSKYDDENDCNDYNERNSNFNSRSYKYDQTQRNYSDNFRHYGRQQSNARGNQNQYEQCDSRYLDGPRRESSIGRSKSRNYVSSRQYSVERKEYRSRDYRYENDSGRNNSDGSYSKNNFNREQSIGRNLPDERNFKGNDMDFTSDKILAVESQAGRSFIIDTSVNQSFQELKVPSFDARRRRASSVGRSLISEQIIESESTNTKYDKRNLSSKSNNKFRRARSVGREIAETQEKKNFKDIKEELQSYKQKHDETLIKSKNTQPVKTIITDLSKKASERDPRISRRDEHEHRRDKNESRTTKTSTPRGHYRDPRLNSHHSFDLRKKYHDDIRSSSRGIKKHGIVYSADNIAKGILGSGYGVKNYKIPKIKKVLEEAGHQNINENDKLSKDKTVDESCRKIEKHIAEKKDGKRSTRWGNSEKNVLETEKDSSSLKTIIADELKNEETSVSKITPDSAETQNSTIESTQLKCDSPKSEVGNLTRVAEDIMNKESTQMVNLNPMGLNSIDSKKTESEITKKGYSSEDKSNDISPNVDEKILANEEKSQLDDNMCNKEQEYSGSCKSKTVNTDDFKIDDILNIVENKQSTSVPEDKCHSVELEVCSDQIAMNPVVNNTNAVVPDICDKLKSSESNSAKKQLIQEIPVDNAVGDITCASEQLPEMRDEPQVEETISDLRDRLEDSHDISYGNDSIKFKENSTINDNLYFKHKSRAEINNDTSIRHSEVSTTGEENTSTLLIKEQTQQNENHVESCSTPDSTIEVNENYQNMTIQEGMPDSTNEFNCDMSSDITSTHISHELKDKLETKAPQNEEKKDPIDSFLSILKDKSKIKELLTMLQDQSSENYKLKKKLEKLSEIVSDDEDVPIESNVSNTQDSNISSNAWIDNENVRKEKDSNPNNTTIDKKNILEVQDLERITNTDKLQIDQQEKCEVPDDKKNENENQISGAQNNPIETESSKKSIEYIKAAKKVKDLKGSSPDMIEKPIKKPSRELKQLQDDIKEMFMHDGFTTNNTGIRMCRLAKLVEDKSSIEKDEKNNMESNPVVLLEKVKQSADDIASKSRMTKKKQTSKTKIAQKEIFPVTEIDTKSTTVPKTLTKLRPGPKSKTKVYLKHADSDPYIFESDSFSESNNTTAGDSKLQNSSDSECESLESSNSFGSTELLAEIKKKGKRKRPGWKAGVIKSKNKKKKVDIIHHEIPSTSEHLKILSDSILDENCFTDIAYCFKKSVTDYSCRFCAYSGNDIVHHYKKQHPHSEIPLSRLSPEVAKTALEQCHGLDFQELRKIPSEKYVCRFCLKEFAKKKNALEAFFWHVVSMHTGEYKQLCSECVNVTKCPFNLDIPPTPKETKGQLTGYVCGKCNYTQVSLENLKSHVINRHDNIETEVFEINLSVMTKKFLNSLKTSTIDLAPRVLRSARLSHISGEGNEQNLSNDKKVDNVDKVEFRFEQDINMKEKRKGKRNKIQSKITFENDDVVKEISQIKGSEDFNCDLKNQGCEQDSSNGNAPELVSSEICSPVKNTTDMNVERISTSDDVFDYPHFKVYYTETGTKEYDCCINGVENHFRTPLLISFKKHVQIKHKEKWDGFCYICKLIVTSQGNHYFKDCLEHFIDKHMDNFPVVDPITVNQSEKTDNVDEENKMSSTYLNVRPLSELISKTEPQSDESPLPVIESVVSLGSAASELSQLCDRSDVGDKYSEDECKYEEAQAAVIGGKNNVVLGIMMDREKLVHIFKCAGRFCSYSTDNAEDALRHAVTHERIGGENSLNCAYCDFDSSRNAVELVTHVFKSHGSSPFVCSMCFYRAAASQLVRAHQLRLHKHGHKIIYRSTVTGRSNATDNILPREMAVPFYDCNQDFGACQFKTYTSGKFAEHLQTRHQADSEFPCWVCSAKLTRILDLIHHMKSHGFKVYQCTWCVYGADSETELLAHASEKHPNKQPQAYLRIITNKEGTTGYRVLPLAQFNNSKVAALDIIPNSKKGNPEREAERSIDLEKLIGQSTQMMESKVKTVENEPGGSSATNVHGSLIGPMETFDSEPLDQTRESLVKGLQSSLLDQIQEELTANASPLAVITPISPSAQSPNLKKLLIHNSTSNAQMPLLKIEPGTGTFEKPNSDVVYCIESDDETPSHNVIDLSTEDVAPTPEATEKIDIVRVPLTRLYKCGICPNTTLKNAAGFKRHVTATHQQELDKLTCAYCSFVGERDAVVKHYVSEHSLLQDTIKRYICGVCENKYVAFSFVKKHLKEDHNLSKLVVSSKQKNKGEYQFVVNAAPKPNAGKQSVKRKLSGEKNDKGSPAAKLKKFGLHDIESLPITPILDELVYCALCEFSTKVRLNMVRHLQLHAEQQPVPQTNPVNPVPHLETNEKHFDKMFNLAFTSSLTSRLDKSNKVEVQPVVNPLISPDTISRLPKYVPDRQRYTCGAKDCCYTSVDENMFKYHWETLHSETNDYRCIHCPPHQHVNTSKSINANRIISHLKMHDMRLYACSNCTFYHNRRQVVEKHIADLHVNGHVLVVREEGESIPASASLSQSVNATPTMDLKPWQCGLCKFKSMLRPEVVEHCAKIHQSKMQYKCTFCAFRASNMENISKHQSKSHGDRVADTFYFYYREGSVPDEPDGTPRWQKQRQKSGLPETQVKTEAVENREQGPQNASKAVASPPPITIPVVDLNIVKKDPDADIPEQPVHDFGKPIRQFCEPNGLKYKCPLCEIVSEESKEAMQSHLYEELQYRKWACGFCSYKAFHKNGLKEHMDTEHRQYREPIELPVDSRVEMWVAKALDHQFLLVEKNRQNMAKQAIVKPCTVAAQLAKQVSPPITSASGEQWTAENLQNMFGNFGDPEGIYFNCPKCNYKIREETLMRDHLEIELHKIRWCCNSCTQKFQNYHEAQFHCKSGHAGVAARAVEAVRDAGKRSAWVSALLLTQKLRMATSSMLLDTAESFEEPEQSSASDNSLLVVRYEERVAIPEVAAANLVKVPPNDSDDDERRLVIDERSKVEVVRQCIFCVFKCKELKEFKEHINQHTDIKPYFCLYCDLNGHRKTLLKHLKVAHRNKPLLLITKAQRGLGAPLKAGDTSPTNIRGETPPAEDDKLICLRCEKSFTDKEVKSHHHENLPPSFAKKSDVVVKCCVCLRLHQDIEAATAHHQASHPEENLNYAYYKLQSTKRSVYCCAYCEQQFKFWRDFKVHCKTIHSSLPLQFNKRNFSYRVTSESGSYIFPSNSSDDDRNLKRKSEYSMEEPPPKMCARKSTSKLPVQSVAKKSTSKLPFVAEVGSEDSEEYCHYGSRPRLDDLDNVRTRMTFCNTDISFTYKQLTEVIKIDPIVLVEDVTK